MEHNKHRCNESSNMLFLTCTSDSALSHLPSYKLRYTASHRFYFYYLFFFAWEISKNLVLTCSFICFDDWASGVLCLGAEVQASFTSPRSPTYLTLLFPSSEELPPSIPSFRSQISPSWRDCMITETEVLWFWITLYSTPVLPVSEITSSFVFSHVI